MWYVVCGMWYVVCGMWYVVCGMWYVLCAMCYVLCAMWYVLCAMCFLINKYDKQYQSIVPNKETKHSKQPTAPKKRKPFLDTNRHSDLLVHWSIDKEKINFNHSFSQGVLKCDVSWNVVQWEENLEKLEKYIDTNDSLPPRNSKNPTVKTLASWVGNQKKNYKKQTYIMKDPMIHNQWTQLMTKHPLLSQTREESWSRNARGTPTIHHHS